MDGSIVVTTPTEFRVDPIPTALAPTPINVDFGVYISSSKLLKKWFCIVNFPVVGFKIVESEGLNVFAKIEFSSEVKLKSVLLILSPLIALYSWISIDSSTVP